MRVGEEKRTWENGKALILDTSFEHETRNDSRRDRIVLIIDYWHPGVIRIPCCSATVLAVVKRRREPEVVEGAAGEHARL